MAISMAVMQRKGGAGKSSFTVNISGELTKRGYKVLMVDLDPQGHLALKLGFTKEAVNEVPKEFTSHALLVEGKTIEPVEVEVAGSLFYLIVGNNHLTNSASDISGRSMKGLKNFSKALNLIKKDFDFVLIDTPGALNLVNLAVCFATDHIIIPVFTDGQSIDETLETIEFIQDSSEESSLSPNILGLVLARANLQTRTYADFAERYLNDIKPKNVKIFKTVIGERTLIQQANSDGYPLAQYSQKGRATVEYENLASEILFRLGVK